MDLILNLSYLIKLQINKFLNIFESIFDFKKLSHKIITHH